MRHHVRISLAAFLYEVDVNLSSSSVDINNSQPSKLQNFVSIEQCQCYDRSSRRDT